MTRARNSADLASQGNLFADISNDRIGIGSVVPTHKLHVAGTSKFDDDVKFEGATAARYITWDKSANILDFSDSTYLTFGDHNGGDLRLYHSGSHSYIKHQGTGNLYTDIGSGDQYSITTSESAHLADFVAGGAVTLRYNGNEKFITTNTGAKVTGNLEVTGVLTYDDVTSIDSVGIVTAREGVVIPDTKELKFGSSAELKISNNGNAGYIQHSGSGYLFIHGNDIALRSTSQKNYIVCDSDQEVTLYYNNSPKFETTNTGATVTGTLTATTLTGALSTTDACQTGDLTILNGNPDLKLKDSNHGGNNTEHMITFQDSSGNNQMNIGSPFGEQHLRIKHGTTDLVKIQTDGKVGINETSPDVDLHIKNTNPALILEGTNGSGRQHKIWTAGTNSETLQITSGNYYNNADVHYFRATNESTVQARIDNTGIGIGGVTPTRELHVHSSGSGSTYISLTNGTTGTTTGDGFGIGLSGDEEAKLWNYENTPMIFATNSTEALRITSTGKVGINQSDPYYNLQINFDNSTTTLSGGSGGNWGGAGLRLENDSSTAGSMSLIHFRTHSADWHVGNKFVSASPDKSDFVFIHEGTEERLRIDSSGRLKVGDNTRPASDANEGAGLRVTSSLTRNQYYSPHGHYFGSIGYTDNTNTKAWLAVDSGYAQSSAVSAGIFLSAFHQDAGGSGCGFTIKNLKTGNPLVISSVTTASSTGNPAVETERLRIASDGKTTITNAELAVSSTAAYTTHLNYNNAGTNYITSANGGGTYFRGSNNSITGMVVLGTGQVDIESKIRHAGDTDTLMEFGTDTITFDTAGSDRLQITSSGQVRILSNDLYFPSTGTIQWNTNILNLRSTASIGVVKVQADAAGNGYAPRFEVFHGDGSHRTHMLQGSNSGDSYLCKGTGQLGIGIEGPHGVSKVTILPNNRTSAFSASDGTTWHDVVLHQGGSATNNAVGIAFQLKNDGSYHANAGTGIAAVKNGTNSDYGSDLVFITRPQSAVAAERVRIQSDGTVVCTGDAGVRVYSTTNGTAAIVRFSDSEARSQVGHIKYQHQDGTVATGYGEGFIIGGTESNGLVVRVDGAIKVPDLTSAGGNGARLYCGTANDFSIWHDGGNASYVSGITNGHDLYLRAKRDIYIAAGDNASGYHTSIYCDNNGGVRLSHDNTPVAWSISGGFKVQGDEGLQVRSTTNDSPARIEFSSSSSSDYAQQGTIYYRHGDNSITTNSQNYGNYFVFDHTESNHLGIRMNGDIHVYGTQGSWITGTTDGVLNLNTTSGNGTFIRFKQSNTSKCWVGCAEGLGGGDQDDLGLRATDKIIFFKGSTARAYFTSSGHFLPWGNNTYNLGSTGDRWKTIYSNNSLNTSDKNEKDNILDCTLGLDFIKKLKPISYKWKEDDGKTHYGLIAQDVEKVVTDSGMKVEDFGSIAVPEKLETYVNEDGREITERYGLSYVEFIAPLIKSIQELSTKVESLQSEIDTLKSS